MIREEAGGRALAQHVPDLNGEPVGVAVIVVVPLADEFAARLLQRDVAQAAERESVAFGIEEAHAFEPERGDVTFERAAEDLGAVRHDEKLAVFIPLRGEGAYRALDQREP